MPVTQRKPAHSPLDNRFVFPEAALAPGCGSAWKRDPVSGVIGVE
jgi:hypothetical protein